MAEITKINIKGVDYDIGGTGVGGLKVVEITEELTDLELVEINEERFNAIKNADAIKFNMFLAGAYYDVYLSKVATENTQGIILFEKLWVQAVGDNETDHVDMTLTPINIIMQSTGSGGVLLLVSSLSKSIPTVLPNTTKTPTATLENLTIGSTTYSIPSAGGGSNIQVVEVDSDTIDLIIG